MHTLTHEEIQLSMQGDLMEGLRADEDSLERSGYPQKYHRSMREVRQEYGVSIIDTRANKERKSCPHRIMVNLAKHLGAPIYISRSGVPIVYHNGYAACWFGSKERRYIKVFWPTNPGRPNPRRPNTRIFKAGETANLITTVGQFMDSHQ